MPNVDTNAPLVTNSDAAMWRQDHASAIRYIEALLAERETWAPVMEVAGEWRAAEHDVIESDIDTETVSRADVLWDILLRRILDALLKEDNADG